MTAPLRDIRLVRDGEKQRAPNLIGLDESMVTIDEVRYTIVVAVRTARENDISLLRALIDNDLQPFKHKSSSLLRHGGVSLEERSTRVQGLIEDLQSLPVSWSAILWEGPDKARKIAACAVTAGKKSITNPLQSGDLAHGCGSTALLHDGREDSHSDYFEQLKLQMPSAFDTSFQQSICSVLLTFMQGADRTYPATNTADYIAGHLARQLENDRSDLPTQVVDFDPSWVDPAPQPEVPYQLDSIRPVREEDIHSRVLAWILGKGIPNDPSPVNRDPYRDHVSRIGDEIVRSYLLDEL
jgi:hypothetical protein